MVLREIHSKTIVYQHGGVDDVGIHACPATVAKAQTLVVNSFVNGIVFKQHTVTEKSQVKGIELQSAGVLRRIAIKCTICHTYVVKILVYITDCLTEVVENHIVECR